MGQRALEIEMTNTSTYSTPHDLGSWMLRNVASVEQGHEENFAQDVVVTWAAQIRKKKLGAQECKGRLTS